MAQSLGLIAGEGALPALVAAEARRAGWRVVAFPLSEASGLVSLADRVVPCGIGEVGPILAVLGEERIGHVVLAGRVRKDLLFRGGPLDARARELVERSPDWTDGGLLQAASNALAAMGIEILDQRRFLGRWLAPAGHVAGPDPAAGVRGDMIRGRDVAREIARHGIGQTVVVRNGTIVAVEGLEGTDETIRRGLSLAGPGAVVVKATGPEHDYRFDIPTVGPATLALCAAGGAAGLAVEAGRVLFADREAMVESAARAGVSVVGLGRDPDAS